MSTFKPNARRAKAAYLPPPKESRLLVRSSLLDADNRERHEQLDADFGYEPLEGAPRKGWLVNMVPVTIKMDSMDHAALDLFFLDPDGTRFKACIRYEPYFYVLTSEASAVKEVKGALERKFEKELSRCDEVQLDDLTMSNHLSGLKRLCVKLSFRNQNDMLSVRKQLLPIASRNKAGQRASDAYLSGTGGAGFFGGGYRTADKTGAAAPAAHQRRAPDAQFASIVDLREHDVTYYQRVCIDLDIFSGSWYEVAPDPSAGAKVSKLQIFEKAQPVVLAFDIECTKQPLKFPDARVDQIFMVSYMVDGEGFLIVNRQFVSADVDDFEFTPKPEFLGPFSVRNVRDEAELIAVFFAHVRQVRPSIFVTYNGDFFDWPFLEQRAQVHGLDMEREIGVGMVMPPQAFNSGSGKDAGKKPAAKPAAAAAAAAADSSDDDNDDDEDERPRGGEYRGRNAVHIDCLYWVKRDSYLPAGSRGLKAVTKAKLGYDPIEIDAEDMEREARERPQHMASYSVSDAVSTFYLYDKYIHLFVFSLCTIIPMGPEDVLRKGSGTLCEALLMVEAFKKRIVCPNKQTEVAEKFYNDHLLETETYVGGHVESLESGVFRSDLPCSFALDALAFDELEANVDRDLRFAIKVELGLQLADCVNLDRVRADIVAKLHELKAAPKRVESPVIYHLDVGAMYPNIILTNRLQPIAIVDKITCSACVHNHPESDCKRNMPWEWRGDMYPPSRAEYRQILAQLETETVDGVLFRDLALADRKRIARQRLKEYSSKTYKRVKDTVTEERQATVCMRENPFYVDTIRAFRDRRNEYKAHAKKWNGAKRKATDPVDKAEADTKALLYDSLQLAHKCILNSFYGYVMRRGARWHSMEMAAIVTRTGADLIKQARRLVERVGKPLELDTDGIWCVLPRSFPGNFTLEFAGGETKVITYPCVMLNADVHANFTNDQYQDLAPGSTRYTKRSECSIFFELDGPYHCMVLPASQEEGKLLKKRYAVFNDNGTLAELKGFEMKRRGELKIIKAFQAQVFERFLKGSTLEECYQSVAEIADFWLDVLYTKGASLTDEEVIELISENRSMSRSLADYGEQKSTAITTAKRLAEFLGHRMTRDKGLACQLFIAKRPIGLPVTDRAIPTAIFSAATDPAVRDACLRRWLREPSLPSDPDVRSIIDWEYYQDRLGKCVQKIITIPAALQRVDNPVPRVKHPDWLARLVREKHDTFKQIKLDNFFSRVSAAEAAAVDAAAAAVEDDDDASNDDGGGERKARQVQATAAKATASAGKRALRVGSREWLAKRKEEWRLRRRRSRRAPSMRPNASSTTAAGAAMGGKRKGDLLGFAKDAREAAEGDVLHVVEFRELPEEPGVFALFALAASSGVLQTRRVVVPRLIYMDSSAPEEEELCEPPRGVTRRRASGMHLPHGQSSKGLFALQMDEALFRARPKPLADYLSRQSVLGVYETHLPLAMRLVLQLGNTVRIASSSSSSSMAATARWDEDLPVSALTGMVDLPLTRRYLDGEHRRVFVFHAGKKDRQIVALFRVHDTEMHRHVRSASATVWLSGGAADDRVNVERLLRDELRAHHADEDASAFAEPPRIVTVAAGAEGCWQALQDELNDIMATRTQGSLLVLAQVGCTKLDLLARVACLNDVPVIELASDFCDFPALQWRRFACKRAVGAFVRHASWLQNHLEGARFAKVPVAMIAHDWALSLSDVLFARNLAHNKMVLWASPNGTPDLGGNESAVGLEALLGGVESPVVAAPGAYRTVCAQIKIEHLAMTAVLEADAVNELDFSAGEGGMMHGAGAATAAETSRAFRVLKGMMSMWYDEAVVAGNVFADAMLTSVYRWLASSKSLLHDPSLHRHVHSLMKKLFLQLLALIRKLGGAIIMANFITMTVDTGKLDVRTGQAFVEHVRETLAQREPFRNLVFAPLRVWSVFLFMDVCNYGGRVVVDDDGGEDTLQEWNLARFLPAKWLKHFDDVTHAVLALPSKARDDALRARAASRAIEDEDDDVPLEERLRRAGDRALQDFVGAKLTPYLIKLLAKEKGAAGEEWFPQLPGSHLAMHNAALEFTKSLCAVLALDPALDDQVLSLKRSLLKQLRVAEFSSEAEFRNPSLSLVLTDVVCGGCGTCEDLDLCRDPRLFKGDDVEFQWQCYRCQHAIDRAYVESALVDVLHLRIVAFQVQDLVCTKCNAVRADNTSEACSVCSGTWTLLTSPAAFKHGLAPFSAVAEYFDMDWLKATVAALG